MASVNEESVFAEALQVQDPGGRAAYLDRACAGNPGLRKSVEALLSAYESGQFLEAPARAAAATVDEPTGERPGTVIGPYRLMEQVGEGGMGLVFVAEQQRPVRRKVALKVLKPGMDTRQVVARFEAERQALALMDHPNIARVFDGGTTDSGRPYFVMELVKGVPITQFCDEHQLAPRERLELFLGVVRAVQHAHQKGVIHRDLKPSNVLVASHDGKPVVKVIDFGIAKAIGQQLTDKTVYTGFAQLIGTPLYMSPEQAGLSSLDIDTRTDVYSLGVLLYELLTGTTPFDGERLRQAAYDEMRRIIREEEPPKPSTRISTLGQAATTISAQRRSDPKRLSQLCRGELDWIVMKALEKDRDRRYETASAFAADVERYLEDEPVLACPPSRWYRFRKLARKHRTLLTSGALVALSLVAGIATSTALAIRATRAEERTEGELAAKKVEHERAEANFLKTLEAVDQLTEVGQKDLASLPHLDNVRRRLLEKALRFFQGFLQERGGEGKLPFETALAYHRIADIRRLLGEHQQAEQAYERAVDLFERLRTEMPEKRAYRQELGRLHYDHARLLSELGRRQDAEAANEQARRLQEQLIQEDPDHADYQYDLANTDNQRGVFLDNSGRPEEAESRFREGADRMEKLLARFPTRAEYYDGVVKCYTNLADLLGKIGKTDPADAAYRRAAAVIDEALTRKAMSSRDFLVMKLTASIGYGYFLERQRRLVDAEKTMRDSVALAEKLTDEFPGIPEYRRYLRMANTNLGAFLHKSGRLDDAEKFTQKALATAEKLAADFPTVPDYQNDLGSALNNLALLNLAQQKPQLARELLERAVVQHEKAVRLNPKVQYRTCQVNRAVNLAIVLQNLQTPAAEVDKVHQQAIDLAQRLVEDYPKVPDHQALFGGALACWGHLLKNRHELARARQQLKKAIVHHKEALKAYPKDQIYLQYLRADYKVLAEVLEQLTGPDVAEELRHCREERDRLAPPKQ
jgi:serine/threonine protein kinase/tetratricopeptide (TPR) repeat protein